MDYTQAGSQGPGAQPAPEASEKHPTLVRGISLTDAVLLLTGGIIGSGLFLTSADVAAAVKTPLLFIFAWVVGMGVSWLASVVVAELGAMFPEAGGQYIYLREAYGEFVAFLYGWMIFTINVTGSLAAIAAGFAAYTGAVVPALEATRPLFHVGTWHFDVGHAVAIAALVFLTWINVIGLRAGVVLQNIATWAKFVAIGAFLLLGFTIGHGNWANLKITGSVHYSPQLLLSGFGVALIAVFWVYDGWVYITWVAGEVKRPERNVPLSLIASVGIVGAIVIGMNMLYLYAMPMDAMAKERTVAETAAQILFFPGAGWWMGLLVAVAAFGAAAACLLSGARVYYAMAKDGVFFKKLAEVHPRWRTPAFSLIVQCVWSCVLVLTGRYDQLFTYVMFVSVIAYAIAASAIFVLRKRRPNMPRPYRCPGYPWVPALYCVICGAWALNALWAKPMESLAGIGIMLVGTPAYYYWRKHNA